MPAAGVIQRRQPKADSILRGVATLPLLPSVLKIHYEYVSVMESVMKFQDEIFQNERVELGGNIFHNCTFEHCELVFDGDRSPTFVDNEFIGSVFVFTDQALRTLYFLANIYHAGEGGVGVVEQTFSAIRAGSFHGREMHTIMPHTSDNSLH